jgi:two-component system sensor histidine kinase YesM
MLEARALYNIQPFSLRNTIFLRLLLTFLLIILPIILMGVYLYQWVVQTASDDISKTAVSQINFYLNELENEVERMKLLQYGLIEDENLNELTLTWDSMDAYTRTEKINSLWKRLYTTQNSSVYIKNVTVHIDPISKSVSSANGAGELDNDRYDKIRSELGGHNHQMMVWDGGLFLCAAKPSATNGARPLFVIEIELDTQKIGEAISHLNTYAGSGTLLLSEKTGDMIVSGATSQLQQNMIALVRQAGGVSMAPTGTYSISGSRYYTASSRSDYLDMALYRFIPEQIIKKPLDKFYVWAWSFLFAAVVIIGVYALSTYQFIHKPLITLVKSFRRMESGDLNFVIAHESKYEFGYLFGRFNQMIANLRSLIDQAYKQKIMAQRAELKQLQSQINPHFLFNSFFILNTMAKTGDLERVELFTTQLGEYFQFVTRNASDEVSLKQEIQHARLYTEIQKLRFSRRVAVQFDDLPYDLEELQVPRLIVQPIIENAFEHSLEQMAYNGRIVIRFDWSETEVRIIVEDNGNRLTDDALQSIVESLTISDEQTETTGMVNIHRRLNITFGDPFGLYVSRGELGGLQVIIRFPGRGGGELV